METLIGNVFVGDLVEVGNVLFALLVGGRILGSDYLRYVDWEDWKTGNRKAIFSGIYDVGRKASSLFQSSEYRHVMAFYSINLIQSGKIDIVLEQSRETHIKVFPSSNWK